MPDDIEPFLIRDLANRVCTCARNEPTLTYDSAVFSGEQLTERLKGVRNIHRFAFLVAQGRAILVSDTGLDSPSVHDDGGTIVANCGHEAPWHVLVAPWYGNVAVVVLCLRNVQRIGTSNQVIWDKCSYHNDLDHALYQLEA